jgi:cyclic pyranopterin phosphate synthase
VIVINWGAMKIQDKYGRTFKTLRVSLTNSCNLGCIYCVHSSDQKTTPDNLLLKTLDYKEIAHSIKKIHALNPLETVRITGGEPTLYKDLIPFIKELKAIGIQNIKMTSNGYLLNDLLPSLAEAGLKKINISLDAVNKESFHKISGRKNIEKVLEAIEKALECNIEIKINAVILKSINEDQIVPLFKFSKDKNITLRFLELMSMGPLYQNKEFEKYFISEKEILKIISENYSFTPLLREDSSTANYWRTSDGYTFGIIANESSPFCHDCNRLRLDSYGNIYGCLSNETAIFITDSLEDENTMREKLQTALSQKQELKFTGSSLSMMAIGG